MANSFLEKGDKFIRIHDGCLGAIMVLALQTAIEERFSSQSIHTLQTWKGRSLNSAPGLIDYDLTQFSSESEEGQSIILLLTQLRARLENREAKIPAAELQASAGESGIWFIDIEPAFLVEGLDKLIPFLRSLS